MNNVNAFLQKSFGSLFSSIILPLNSISFLLVKTAKAGSYVETLGENADSLHSWIKRSYEEDFRRSFELQVQKALKSLGVSIAKLAFDTTDEPFYGKTRGLYIFNTKDEKYGGVFKFITVCVIVRNKQIPLMALPVRVGEGWAKKSIQLLEYCRALFKGIRLTVWDRSFYVSEIEGKIQDYVNQTTEFGKFKHQMEYAKKKSKWRPHTTIVVCKGIDDFAWIFATNINFRTRVEYIWHYKRRWQIETNYRVEDEGRIKSKSTSYLIRYFYFLVSLLLHLLWIVNKNLRYYVPYKKYLEIIEGKLLFEYLGIDGI